MKSRPQMTEDRSNWTEQQWKDFEREQQRKYRTRRDLYILAVGFVWALSYVFFEHFWDSLAVDILQGAAGLFLLVGIIFGAMWLWHKLRGLKNA